MEWESTFKWLIPVIGAGISFVFGDVKPLMSTLFILMMLDFVSGFIASKAEGNLNSARGHFGIGKKVMTWLIIAVAHHVDIMLGTNAVIRDSALFFYCVNEGLSIVENAGRAGLPVPQNIMQTIEVLRNGRVKEDETPKDQKNQ